MPTLGQVAVWEYLHLQQAKVETFTFVLEHSSHRAKRKTQTYKMRVEEREQEGRQSFNIKQKKTKNFRRGQNQIQSWREKQEWLGQKAKKITSKEQQNQPGLCLQSSPLQFF